jgi:hypothetical protein
MRQEENGSGQAARVSAGDLLDRGRDPGEVIGPEPRRNEDDTSVVGIRGDRVAGRSHKVGPVVMIARPWPVA